MPQKNKTNIVPIRPTDPFTKDAKMRWDTIPSSAQSQILDNVFCGKCRGSVAIILETATMQRSDFILRGKCKVCGEEVCRLVEPENG